MASHRLEVVLDRHLLLAAERLEQLLDLGLDPFLVSILTAKLVELLRVLLEVFEAVPVLARERLQRLVLLGDERPQPRQLGLPVPEPLGGVGVDLRVEALDSLQLRLDREVDLLKLVDLQRQLLDGFRLLPHLGEYCRLLGRQVVLLRVELVKLDQLNLRAVLRGQGGAPLLQLPVDLRLLGDDLLQVALVDVRIVAEVHPGQVDHGVRRRHVGEVRARRGAGHHACLTVLDQLLSRGQLGNVGLELGLAAAQDVEIASQLVDGRVVLPLPVFELLDRLVEVQEPVGVALVLGELLLLLLHGRLRVRDVAFDLLQLAIHGLLGAGERVDLLGELRHLRGLVLDLLPCVDLAAAEVAQGEAKGADLCIEPLDLLVGLKISLLGAIALALQLVERLLARACLLLGGFKLFVEGEAVDDGPVVVAGLREVGARIDDLEVGSDAREVAVARHLHALVVGLHEDRAAEDVAKESLQPRVGVRRKLDQVQQRLDAGRDLLLRPPRHVDGLERINRDDAATQLLVDLEHGLRRLQRVDDDRRQLGLRRDVDAGREPLRAALHKVDQAAHVPADVVGLAPLLDALERAKDRLTFLELADESRHLLLLDLELLHKLAARENVLFELGGRLPPAALALVDLLHSCAQFCLELGNLALHIGCGLFAILHFVAQSPLLTLGVTLVRLQLSLLGADPRLLGFVEALDAIGVELGRHRLFMQQKLVAVFADLAQLVGDAITDLLLVLVQFFFLLTVCRRLGER